MNVPCDMNKLMKQIRLGSSSFFKPFKANGTTVKDVKDSIVCQCSSKAIAKSLASILNYATN